MYLSSKFCLDNTETQILHFDMIDIDIDTHMRLMFTDLSVTIIFHYLPNLELNEVYEEGFREVFKSICCSQVWDQTPLLKQHTEYIKNYIYSHT